MSKVIKLIPTLESLALVEDSIRNKKKRKPVRQASKIIVGTALIKETAKITGGL